MSLWLQSYGVKRNLKGVHCTTVDAIGSNEMQEPNCKIFQIIPYLANYSGSYLVNYSASYLANYFGSTLANYSGMS
jgi:hypothetical protein